MPSTINRTLPAQNSPMLSNEMRQQFGRAADDIDALQTGKANLASPALTGAPTAPTATAGTNTTQVATTAFVRANAVTNLQGNAVAAGTPATGQILQWTGSTWAAAAATGGTPDPTALALRPMHATNVFAWIPDGTQGIFYGYIPPGSTTLLNRPPVASESLTWGSRFVIRAVAVADRITLRAERYGSGPSPDAVFTSYRHKSGDYWYGYYGWQLDPYFRWVTVATFPLEQLVIPTTWTRIPIQQVLEAAQPNTYMPQGNGRIVLYAYSWPDNLELANYNQSQIWRPLDNGGSRIGQFLLTGDGYGNPGGDPWHIAFHNDWSYISCPWPAYGGFYWRTNHPQPWYPWAAYQYVQVQIYRNPDYQWF